MDSSIELKKQEIIIASEDKEVEKQIEDIKKTLQPNQQVVVTKSIVAAVLIVETSTS